jgi:CBS domain containing-hemolysin-like protein
VARCAHHVPEGLPADELLRQLQKRHHMVAIVKDEYGGTAGIVSMEDVLEEIVGDIVDEYDVEEPEIVQEADTQLLCEAGIGLHQLEPYVSDDLPTEEYDSLGGLVLDLAGRIPAAGDQFQWQDLTFTIVSVSGPRLERIRVSFPPPVPPWQAGVGDDDE